MNLRKSARKQHQAGPFVALRLELALFLRRYRTRIIDNGIALNADITLRQIILGQAPSRQRNSYAERSEVPIEVALETSFPVCIQCNGLRARGVRSMVA